MKYVLSIVFCLSSVLLFSQEPDNQPTNLFFSSIKPYSYRLEFVPSDADRFLVVRSLTPSTFVPQDGVDYQVGQGVGTDGKIMSFSSSSYMTIRETYAGVKYYHKIFASNGSGSSTVYKSDNPLSGEVISAGKQIGSYYEDINIASPNLVSALTARLRDGKVLYSYFDYANVMPSVFQRDTVNGQKVLTCQYSNEQKVYNAPFGFTDVGYSREHVLPRSWMPTGGEVNYVGTQTEEGSDYHNLLLTKNGQVNNTRSNNPFGEVVTITSQYLDGKYGKDANNINVYEPREAVKGDVARAIFYQIVCYNGQGGFNWSFDSLPNLAEKQDVQLLIDWHTNDPVSPEEIARHEYVYFLQNNRNPFIDYPDLVYCIDFEKLKPKASCTSLLGTTTHAVADLQVDVFPNPASDYLTVNFDGLEARGLKLYNMQGVEVRAMSQAAFVNNNSVLVNINDLTSGLYIVSLQTNEGVISKKVIIRH